MQNGKHIHLKSDFVFDEATHGPKVYSRLTLHPSLAPTLKSMLLTLIYTYFCCFIKRNVQITINDYTCHIDTGDAASKIVKHI